MPRINLQGENRSEDPFQHLLCRWPAIRGRCCAPPPKATPRMSYTDRNSPKTCSSKPPGDMVKDSINVQVASYMRAVLRTIAQCPPPPPNPFTQRDLVSRPSQALTLQVASYMRAVLRTIAQCHAQRILHRDVKPGNFMLLEDQPLSPVKAIGGLSLPAKHSFIPPQCTVAVSSRWLAVFCHS